MANVKITDMTPGAALGGTELFESVQGAATVSLLASQLRTYVQSLPMDFVGGTQTTDDPAISATQTWNAGGVTFTAIRANITSTASAAASMLIDLQVAGVSQFNVSKAGLITSLGGLAIAGPITGATTGVFSGALSAATLKTAGVAVAALGAATAGLRNHVTDANTTLTAGIGAVVAGGGANIVPVFADGTNWRIG